MRKREAEFVNSHTLLHVTVYMVSFTPVKAVPPRIVPVA